MSSKDYSIIQRMLGKIEGVTDGINAAARKVILSCIAQIDECLMKNNESETPDTEKGGAE